MRVDGLMEWKEGREKEEAAVAGREKELVEWKERGKKRTKRGNEHRSE